MTKTALAAMIVDNVEPRARPSFIAFAFHPMDCDHLWEPHLVETGRAYCPRCGSFARWADDPRLTEDAS